MWHRWSSGTEVTEQYHEHSYIMWFWLLQISQFLRKRNKFRENWQVAEVLLMQHIQCQLHKEYKADIRDQM